MSGIIIQAIHKEHAEKMLANYAERGCLSLDRLLAYADGGEIIAWCISNPIRFKTPRPLDMFGLEKPPQSWQYLKA